MNLELQSLPHCRDL